MRTFTLFPSEDTDARCSVSCAVITSELRGQAGASSSIICRATKRVAPTLTRARPQLFRRRPTGSSTCACSRRLQRLRIFPELQGHAKEKQQEKKTSSSSSQRKDVKVQRAGTPKPKPQKRPQSSPLTPPSVIEFFSGTLRASVKNSTSSEGDEWAAFYTPMSHKLMNTSPDDNARQSTIGTLDFARQSNCRL